MATAGVLDVNRQREIAQRLRERAQNYRELWRECNADAAALEAQLPEHAIEYVTVKAPVVRRERYEIMVREVAYELTQGGATFLTADVVDAGVPYQSALKWLKEWESRGLLSSIHEGRELVWERVKYESETVNRERRPAPETNVVQLERSRSPVAGTGRSKQATDPGVRALIEQCRAKGAQVNPLKSGHGYEVRKNNKKIGWIPNTPSDYRSLPNARAELRRNGLLV